MYEEEMFAEYPECLTVKDLCEMLPLGATTIRAMLKSNVIPSCKLGGKIVVFKCDLIHFLRTQMAAVSERT